MFIVVISVGVAGILSVMSYTTQHSADPMARQQAILIAESYMEEILLKPFLDPSSPAATQVCPVKEASRAAYDNVCDYNALLDDGVRDQQGNLVSGLTAYNISISVTGDAGVALGPTASQIVNTLPNTIRVLRIDLTVTHDDIPICRFLTGNSHPLHLLQRRRRQLQTVMTRRAPEFLSSRAVAGFMLVEMVVTILIMGILGATLAAFITRPVEGYRDLARRTALVDAAESALRRMQRDIRIALPNSVRVTNLGGGGFALEMLPTQDGGKFREGVAAPVCERLRFDAADMDYDILGGFHNITPGVYTNYRMVINNRGTPGNNAYEGSASVITPLGTTVTITRPASAAACAGNAVNDHVNLSVGHQYGGSGPQPPHLCHHHAGNHQARRARRTAAGTLIRYEAYAITVSKPTSAAEAPLATATSAVITNQVSACSVITSTVDVRNRSLVTLTLDLAEEGEQIRLINQTQLNNSR